MGTVAITPKLVLTGPKLFRTDGTAGFTMGEWLYSSRISTRAVFYSRISHYFDICDLRFYASTDVEVTGKTSVFGIIGDPVSHSLSPLFQARFAIQHGIDAVYVPWCVQSADVETALAGLWAADVQGFNITVPHKQTVLAMVQADVDASAIGAVNTVRRIDDGWEGINTDWRGIASVLRDMQADIGHQEVLVIGAGGTARAVLHALAVGGAQHIHICNRSENRVHALLQHAAKTYSDTSFDVVPWDTVEVEACTRRCPLVINTTAIGLGDVDAVFPFHIAGDGIAVDVVYTPSGETPFVLAARSGGRRAVDGLPMLLAQGAASFDWWHDVHTEVGPVMQWMEQRLQRSQAVR